MGGGSTTSPPYPTQVLLEASRGGGGDVAAIWKFYFDHRRAEKGRIDPPWQIPLQVTDFYSITHI